VIVFTEEGLYYELEIVGSLDEEVEDRVPEVVKDCFERGGRSKGVVCFNDGKEFRRCVVSGVVETICFAMQLKKVINGEYSCLFTSCGGFRGGGRDVGVGWRFWKGGWRWRR